MKNNFRGWATVFNFTFRQSTKKSFKLTTTLIAFLIIGAIIIINIVSAKPEDREYDDQGNYYNQEDIPSGISSIKKVVIQDKSGLPATDYSAMHPGPFSQYFSNTEFITLDIQTRSELLDYTIKDSDNTIAVIITSKDGVFEFEAMIPHNSVVATEDVNHLLNQMTSSFEGNKIMHANLSDEALTAVFTPVIASYSEFGESSSEIAMVIKILTPMVFSFLMYFMLLFYGQNVSKSVSTEKTSKLMETLLTSIHPYAMITGKVLASTAIAIIQFISWILAGVVGLYGGNAIAHYLYPGYESSVISFINFIKDNIGETGMTLPAVLLAILVFGIGFMFYCVIAALAGCMVSRPEDVASTQGLFQFPIIISWLLSYFGPLSGNYRLTSVLKYIPFTAPFSVPADVITGTTGLAEGLLYLIILTVFTFIVVMLSAKIYKGLVLYNGQKANMNILLKILKS